MIMITIMAVTVKVIKIILILIDLLINYYWYNKSIKNISIDIVTVVVIQNVGRHDWL